MRVLLIARVVVVNMPILGRMVEDAVAAFITGTCAGTLVHCGDGDRVVLLLDGHGGKGAVEGACGNVSCGGGSSSSGGLSSATACLTALAGGGHGGMEGGEFVHHALVLLLLVCVYGLSMLTEVVEAGKLFSAVTSKGSLACVFSGK